MTTKQYHYTFCNYVAEYTIVATSYAQAKRHILKVLTGFSVVVYKGRWHGGEVRNGQCVSVVAR